VARLHTVPSRLPTAGRRVPIPAAGAAVTRVRGTQLQVIRDRILHRAKGLCECNDCAEYRRARLARDVDHVTPLWAGGQEDDDNRMAIAGECHTEKNACEAHMRATGGWNPGACTCNRHV
jgi:5-methylcytosine-specific restriction endonuclease McrA